jgi:MYXO-CTERM domain-containing protein
MKLRALIGVTVSSLALCSAAHASLATTDSSTTQKAATAPSASPLSQAVLGRVQGATLQSLVPGNRVPEPESWTLAVLALGAMALVRRRKSRSK